MYITTLRLSKLLTIVPFDLVGISMSEAHIWEPNPELAFWGHDNYQQLLEVKAKVDPEKRLMNWGSVGWNRTSDRFRCYPKQT